MVYVEKELKKELFETKDFLISIIENSPDGLMIVGLEGTIITVNQRALDLLGKSLGVEHVIDKDAREILADIPELVSAIERQIKEGRTDFEIVSLAVKRADAKKEGFLFVRGRKIPLGTLILFQDITELSVFKALNKAKDEFVSFASHQLRTPLSAIAGFTELLLDDGKAALNSEQKDNLQQIQVANRRMLDLITALLDTSKIELGVFPVELSLISFADIADIALGELDLQIKERKQTLEKRFDPVLPKINADQKLTKIIFQNLLSNAVKYTPLGGRVAVTLEKQNADILIKVADSGIGVPQAQQPHIFSKLFRADNAREADASGTGLGLYMVKSIVESLGGSIRFESVENKGTTFFVTIPLVGMKRNEGAKGLT
jgi:PAS domain S-box-containing protein